MEEKNKSGQNSIKSLLDHQILDAMGDSISVQDTDFKIIYMNKAAIRMVGNHIGESCYKVFEGRDSVCDDCPLAKAYKDGKRHRVERKSVLKGRTYAIEIIASSVKDSNGKIIAGIEAVRNITGRKKAEDALEKSEERWSHLVESSPMGIHLYELKPDDRLVFIGASPMADKILGVDNSQFIGKTIEEAFPPLASTEVPERYRQVCKTGEPWNDEHISYEDKKIKGIFEVHAFQTSPGMMATMFFDITERKKAKQALLFNEERYRSLVESTEDSIYLVDKNYKYLFMNRQHLSRLEISKEDYVGKKYGDIHSAEDTEEFYNLIDRVFEMGESSQQEYKAQKNEKYFLRTLSPVKDKEGKVVAVTIVSKNITDRKQFEYQLQLNEEMYRSLVESTEDSIYLVDRNYKYIFMNKKHQSRVGLSNSDFIDRSYVEIHSSAETKEFIKMVDKVFDIGLPVQQDHKSSRDKMYFLRTLSPVKDKNGKVVAVTVLSKNITDRKKMEEDLRTLAITDELTGLYNRRGFLTLAGQQLKLANRLKREVLIFYADLDDLKAINDRYGHQEGDRVILETADLLREVFRESDIIARIGGDEFVVFPVQITDSSTETLSERFNEHLKKHNEKRESSYSLSISVGIAYYEECRYSIEELLVMADKLMYEQKKSKHKE